MNKTTPEKQLRIYELYDLWHEPLWQQPWFLITISCLIILLCIIIIWLIVRYRKKRQTLLSPWQEALKRLSALDMQRYSDAHFHKEFYHEITKILKTYLNRRYGLNLASQTDEEVLIAIKNTEFPSPQHVSLEKILQGALLIKFANHEAAQEQIKADLECAKECIRQTIPPSTT